MLYELITCFGSQYNTVTKNALGKIFGAIMDKERQHIDFRVLVSLLANTTDPVMYAIKVQILVEYRKLFTSLSFMVLDELSDFLFDIEYIDTSSIVIMTTPANKTSLKKSGTNA